MHAFVLMPFDAEFDAIYTDIIARALSEAGFDCKRADSFVDQHNILHDIIGGIARADLIVADLTTQNANVLYELGVAHSLNKATILIAQDLAEIPFDLRAYKTLVYSTHFRDARKLHERLLEIGRIAKDGKLTFSNPVSDFTPRIASNFGPRKDRMNEEFGHVGENTVDEEESGVLDFAVAFEDSVEQINQFLEQLAARSTAMSFEIGKITKGLGRSEGSASPGSARERHRLIQELSNCLTEYCRHLETDLPNFHSSWVKVEENGLNIIFQMVISDEEEEAKATLEGIDVLT